MERGVERSLPSIRRRCGCDPNTFDKLIKLYDSQYKKTPVLHNMSKIWIPRSTSGFTGADGAIKIGGNCYRAIQKNITKAQAPTASSYHEPTHGSLGEKFNDCSSCDATGSSWGAVFLVFDVLRRLRCQRG